MLLRNKSLRKSSLQESCYILKDLPSPAIAGSQLKGQEIQVGNAQVHLGAFQHAIFQRTFCTVLM